MQIETSQKTEKIFSFQDLKLDIPIEFTKFKNESLTAEDHDKLRKRKFNKTEIFKCKFNEKFIEVEVVNNVYFDGTFSVTINAKEPHAIVVTPASVQIAFSIDDLSNLYEAETYVNNPIKLKGIGTALWEASIPLIQQFSDKFQNSVRHRVTRNPSNGLTVAKWNELFEPLLEKYEYVNTGSNSWVKVYEPNK